MNKSKNSPLFWLAVIALMALLLQSCSGVGDYLLQDTRSVERITVQSTQASDHQSGFSMVAREYDAGEMKKVIQQADYDFYNAKMYKDKASWKGRMVAIPGHYPGDSPRNQLPVNAADDDLFYLASNHNGRNASMMVKLDHPLPKQGRYDQSAKTISPGTAITVFGILGDLENIIYDDGFNRLLPVMQAFIIYHTDDQAFKKPIWVSARLEYLPEGHVSVDSLKYEFDIKKKP